MAICVSTVNEILALIDKKLEEVGCDYEYRGVYEIRSKIEQLLQPELKSCPLCNSEAEVWSWESDSWVVECTNEECGIELIARTKEEAIDKWNTRTIPATATVMKV
jgi:hypothetical protein